MGTTSSSPPAPAPGHITSQLATITCALESQRRGLALVTAALRSSSCVHRHHKSGFESFESGSDSLHAHATTADAAQAAVRARARASICAARSMHAVGVKALDAGVDTGLVTLQQLRIFGQQLRRASAVPCPANSEYTSTALRGSLEVVHLLETPAPRLPCVQLKGSWLALLPEGSVGDAESSHCQATGKRMHVVDVSAISSQTCSIAVSVDAAWLVACAATRWSFYGRRSPDSEVGLLAVFSLPGGELVRRFGDCGAGPLQFSDCQRMCFAHNGNLLVVERGNRRVQEVTLTGVFVRFLGVCDFDKGPEPPRSVRHFLDVSRYPNCVSAYERTIAVGCAGGTSPRVLLFDAHTGAVVRQFGVLGFVEGQLSGNLTGLCFSPDGGHVFVAEWQAKRVSQFTLTGEFVRCIAQGLVSGDHADIAMTQSGALVLSACMPAKQNLYEYRRSSHEMAVFTGPDFLTRRSWLFESTNRPNKFTRPCGVSVAGKHVYVADDCSGVVVYL